MSNLYFIGGAPRTGKTTIVQKILKQNPMLAASTDAIRAVALGLVSEETDPGLHRIDRGLFGSEKHLSNLKNNQELLLKQELASAEATWKSVLDFVGYYQKDAKDALVEGVAILPSELAKVDFDFKAVFIVNLMDQTEEILRHARENSFDWLSKYDDETIRQYAAFNLRWNQYYANEAVKYGFHVVEIQPENFHKSIDKAVELLAI
jgi:2-phosphoglycerate kinase